MKKLKKFNIDEAASERMTSDEIKRFLTENSHGFIFQKVIEGGHHYSDVAIYYLEASYICEEVATLGKTTSFKVGRGSGYYPVAQFKIVPEQLEKLHQLLVDFCHALSGEYEEGEDEFPWIDSIERYKDNITTRKLKFPALADDYFANLIHGAYSEYESNYDDPEEFRRTIIKHDPEHVFGFWKCMYSDAIQQDFYVSTDAWIIPPQSDLKKVLSKHSSIKKTNLKEGSLFSLNGGYYVISESYVLAISFPALAKAIQCINYVFKEARSLSDQHDWLDHLHGNYKVSVSDLAGFVAFRIYGYNIILWNPRRLMFNDISLLNRSAAAIFMTTSALIGLKAKISCDWSMLNAETFEDMCYDIVYHDPQFDHKTIQKMGKTKSRDGGRDIIIYTQERLGYKPKKFIFQCKYLQPGKSLTGSKVPDISDIIEQYGADGYGIFTSGIIDSTLYDKVEAIRNRKQIKTELYSVYELERTLAQIPTLKERYFKSDETDL